MPRHHGGYHTAKRNADRQNGNHAPALRDPTTVPFVRPDRSVAASRPDSSRAALLTAQGQGQGSNGGEETQRSMGDARARGGEGRGRREGDEGDEGTASRAGGALAGPGPRTVMAQLVEVRVLFVLSLPSSPRPQLASPRLASV